MAVIFGGPLSGARAAPSRIVIAPPDLQGWKPIGAPVSDADRVVTARHFRSPIYLAARWAPRSIGWARAGTMMPAEKVTGSGGCRRGQWYQVARGYVCTTRGFSSGRRAVAHRALPRVGRLLPYDYVKKTDENARLLLERPTKAQVLGWRRAKSWKAPRSVAMRGDFLLAVVKRETIAGEVFYRTARSRYVSQRVVEPFAASRLRGERLRAGWRLPIAFVYGADRALYDEGDAGVHKVGVARKYARFTVEKRFDDGDRPFVADARGYGVAQARVRIARRIARPAAIPAKARWIHVDLDQQVLVAYRGDDPVFATLIASGKAGYEPPSGLFRVSRKRVSSTMTGRDDEHGSYTVQEVPWTQFYHQGYALHGAYWHDDFGTPKSHGCTNLAPADAYWLFRWTTPRLARGWHSAESEGTYVWFTSDPGDPDPRREASL